VALDRDVRLGTYGNVDALYVVRDGRVLADHRYARDYREISRGRTGPIGCGFGCTDPSWMHQFNYFHPDWHPYYQGRGVHSLQSVTKSIAATLIGVALHRGELAKLDTPLLTYFKDWDLSKVDSRLHRATLEDVLTMRTGIEWHEQDRPLDATNTTIQLEAAKDWIQFTLAQPMDAEPGTKWAYNSGGSMLLSAIIRSATGTFIDDYAREHLFGPLGIRDFHWKRTPTGHPDTEGGLYLSAPDLAKIGQLYLADGVWEGRRVLPAGFAARATARHVTGVAGTFDYGYQWWITRRGDTDVWAGRGFGGQLLIVVPSRRAVAVVHAWNVFGTPARNVFGPLLDALVTSSAGKLSAGFRPPTTDTVVSTSGRASACPSRCAVSAGQASAGCVPSADSAHPMR
jgi:CubicO group peptidase (beta-lactamase class C family)